MRKNPALPGTLKLFAALMTTAAIATACGATDNGGGGTGSPTPTPGSGQIANIQQGNVPVDSSVTLTGVVVTAVRAAGNGVDFWAQDSGGGAWSGIYFFDQNALTPAGIAVGDEITVSGTYVEFVTGDAGDTISEIVVSDVTISNSGLTPTIDVVAAADIGTELNGTGAEKWEGCLIEIDGSVTVADTALGFGEYLVSNGTDTFRVDDLIFDTLASRSAGEELTYVAGVSHYAFDNYKLEPRSDADVVGTVVAPVVATIADLQDTTSPNHPTEGALVTVEDAIVTAVSPFTNANNETRTSFWIQQGTTAGPFNGVFVFDQSYTNPTVAVGDMVTFTAKYTEFASSTDTITELVIQSDFPIPAPTSQGNTPVVLTIALADLMADPEPYEGVLLKLDANVTVDNLNPDDPNDYNEYTVTDGAVSMRIDDFNYDSRTGLAIGQTLSTVQGQFHYSFDNYKLEPRFAADIQ